MQQPVMGGATEDASTVGIILAAGAGLRYGYPKILVPGWLDTALGALHHGGVTDLRVVTGAARIQLPAAVTEIYCPIWERGMGASLRAGLESVRPGIKRIVIHVVDCPDINAKVIERVLSSHPAFPARAVYAGRPGHPVIIPWNHIPLLLSNLRDATGAGAYLEQLADLRRIECSDLASGMDIDTRQSPIPNTPCVDLDGVG